MSEKTDDYFHYNQRKIQLEKAVQNCQNWREKLVNNIEESCGELTVNKMPVIFSLVVQTGFIFLGAKKLVLSISFFILVSRNIGRLF